VRPFRAIAALVVVTAVAVAVALVAGRAGHGSPAAHEGSEQQGLAFKKHAENLLGLDNKDGPSTYEDQVAALNAFPADSATSAQLSGAQAAAQSINGHGYGRGKHSTTSWYSLGPNQSATYPAFLNRHGTPYVASGRITALAIAPTCDKSRCTVWVAAAGGGVWKTDKALSGNPNWQNVSDGAFTTGAVGSLTYDAAHDTLYAGTGELGGAQDTAAGQGIFKSTDGGATWTALGGNASFTNRAIRQIAVDPNDASGKTIYVADGRGVRGINGTNAGPVSFVPGAPAWGLYKSTDGGQTFKLLAPAPDGRAAPDPTLSSFGTNRGVTDVALDPTHAGVVYASGYGVGVWRSTDDGATWTNIHTCQTSCSNADRAEFALATTPDGHTRMYQTDGDTCDPQNPAVYHGCHDPKLYAHFYVADAVESGSPTFVDKSSDNPASPGFATWDFCTAQCWYDAGVYVPAGQWQVVYVFGSYSYAEAPDASGVVHNPGNISNGRAVLLSRDGGDTFTDLTEDATSPTTPNGIHPDQHALVTNPSNPLQFFEGSDGGLVVSDGTLVDTSSRCDSRPISGDVLARCKQLLSAVPGTLTSLNRGLDTLQFQGAESSPFDPKDVEGGTQDNGTWESFGSVVDWPQTIFGDGGQSGFDVGNPHFRFHTYFVQQVDVSFKDGAAPSWDWIADPLFSVPGDSGLFYIPINNDPVVSGTMFAGTKFVWRTTDDGGPQAYLDSNCNEFTGTFAKGTTCGDWQIMGTHSLTGTFFGADRSGGNVAWIARGTSDAGTVWAATSTGRLFVTKSGNAGDASTVAFDRIDNGTSPTRAISGIYVDPANANHAWVTYLGFNTTPGSGAAGHVFSVTYDPATHAATFTSLDNVGASQFGDQPANSIAYDKATGDLYAATDFGVVRLAADDTASGWVEAAKGLPNVFVPQLTINSSARQLLAATHGRGVYQLTLP
jgi:hypothetical protein